MAPDLIRLERHRFVPDIHDDPYTVLAHPPEEKVRWAPGAAEVGRQGSVCATWSIE